MAWNEPGGGKNNNDQDPWRGGGGDGPPDLDEVVKKIQQKFGGIFGGKGGGRSSGSGGGNPFAIVGVVVVIAAVVWALYGFYRVEEAEKAVVLRFGKFHTITSAGLHWAPPIVDEILTVNTLQVSSHSHQASMLTEDQNIVDVQLEVQYRVNDPRNYFLEVSNPGDALRQATESALRHVVGGMEMTRVITEGREIVALEAKQRLQNYLERYKTGLLVTKVNIEDAHPPKEVRDAFDDVIKAKEDEQRFINEAETYANGIIPEARGKKQRMLEEANAYRSEVVARAEGETKRFTDLLVEYQKAPKVTRQRLYLETVEQVLSNSSKIMVDVEGGNNMFYMPLDKILEQQRRSGGQSQSSYDYSGQSGSESQRYRSNISEGNSSRSGSIRSMPTREGR